MPVWAWILIAVGAVLLVVLVVSAWSASRRRERLRGRFGPEYGRVVEQSDNRRRGERELVRREKRREQLEIVPLAPEARERYVEEWRIVQAGFVDEPEAAIREADKLVTRVMRDRGYPMDDFEQRAADVSVDHPGVVENYRAGHAISGRGGGATTEDLRVAMVHYRALFDELLGERQDEQGVPVVSREQDDGGDDRRERRVS